MDAEEQKYKIEIGMKITKELKEEIVILLIAWIVGSLLVFYYIMIPSMADDLRRCDLGYRSKSFVESLRYTFLQEKISDEHKDMSYKL